MDSMEMAAVGVRKRLADDGAEMSILSLAVKKTRFEMEGEVLRDIDSSPDEMALFSPPSIASTDLQSLAETSATSQTSSKRPKKYICPYDDCGKAFDRPAKLEDHINTHTGERPHVCKEEGCDKTFFKAGHLDAHMKLKHTAEAKFFCTYVISTSATGDQHECGKAFFTSGQLKNHVKAHVAKEDLKCYEPDCGRVFRKMKTLQEHIKKDHLGEKAYRCTKPASEDDDEECGQLFSTPNRLKTHEIKEHEGPKHFCEICSPPGSEDGTPDVERVGFHTYTEYKAHMKDVHPPTCTLCHKVCASNRALTAHMEIEHSTLVSRQTHVCEYPDCGRAFTKLGNLNVHIQTVHVKVKKFVCGTFDLSDNEKCPDWDAELHGCGLAFKTKANLEDHTRTKHLGLERMYPPKSRRLARKIKKEGSGGVNASFSMMDLDDAAPRRASSQPSTLDLLTGNGYEDNRPIACWTPGCPVRFVRQYDLEQHMELKHGWNIDDINDVLVENEMIDDDKFWIGGDIDPMLGYM